MWCIYVFILGKNMLGEDREVGRPMSTRYVTIWGEWNLHNRNYLSLIDLPIYLPTYAGDHLHLCIYLPPYLTYLSRGHIHTYIHTYMHTLHTYIHTYIHKYTRYIHTYIPTAIPPSSRMGQSMPTARAPMLTVTLMGALPLSWSAPRLLAHNVGTLWYLLTYLRS